MSTKVVWHGWQKKIWDTFWRVRRWADQVCRLDFWTAATASFSWDDTAAWRAATILVITFCFKWLPFFFWYGWCTWSLLISKSFQIYCWMSSLHLWTQQSWVEGSECPLHLCLKRVTISDSIRLFPYSVLVIQIIKDDATMPAIGRM